MSSIRSLSFTKDDKELFPIDDRRFTEALLSTRSRSWWDRSFSTMKPGSLRGSIFTLIASCIGVGILTLPYICKMVGLIIGILLTTFGMLIAFWSFNMLIFSSETIGTRRYLNLCKAAGGDKLGALYQAAICIQQFGVVLSCQIIGGTIISQACYDFNLNHYIDFLHSNWFNSLKIIIPTILISFPLCKQHDMTSLRYPSLIAILAIMFAIVLIIVHSFYAISFENHFDWYKFDINFFSACGVTFFAYQCQPTFFPVYNDLENPTVARISKVVFRSIMFEYLLYVIVAGCGYLSFLDETLPVITNNSAINPLFQCLFNIARVMVYVKLTISIPINFNPLKRTFYDFIYGSAENLKEPQYFFINLSNTFVTVGLLSVSTFVAIVFPKIVSVISLIGSVASVIIGFVLPCFCYLKAVKTSARKGFKVPKYKVIGSIVVAIFSTLLGIMSFSVTVYSIIKGIAN